MMAEMLMQSPDWRGKVGGFSQNLDASRRGDRFQDLPVYTLEELEPLARTHLAVCVLGDCAAKKRFAGQAEAMSFEFATLVHPRALLSPTATVGAGLMLGFGSKIGPFNRIGRHCTFNSQTLIGESCEMGDFSYVGPGARIAGSVRIGAEVYLGINATVSDHLTIGDGATIGAGTVVIRDVPAGATVVGNPARELPRQP
jgi:sugar O-acyltransferase (sialic acid O-acetyltransferase NeuD family)